jgi:hypothetical protein
MDLETIFRNNQNCLEDFWGRRRNRPCCGRTVQVFDRRVELRSNDAGILEAVEHCLPLYSSAPLAKNAAFLIQFVVQTDAFDPGPAPENLIEIGQYTGDATWLVIRLGAWAHCTVDLEAGRAVAVLSPSLAARPDLVGQCLLNTVLTNFLIGSGYGMLHASCLARDDHALLLMAPHNSGKSTTALRLAMAGYSLVSDSMVFLSPEGEAVQLFGFPVGKIKLRRDMLPAFPHLALWLSPEPVGEEIKYGVDLRRIDLSLVQQAAITPLEIDLCLLTRASGEKTVLAPATRDDAGEAIVMNSLFFDTQSVWQRNLALLGRLLQRARCHHLVIGSDPDGILASVESLRSDR